MVATTTTRESTDVRSSSMSSVATVEKNHATCAVAPPPTAEAA
jgi:hypothetical protein